MPRVVFFTRGGEGWGTGHLHRTNWLAAGLFAAGRPALAVEIRCLDSPEAREFCWATGCVVDYFADQGRIAQDVGIAEAIVVDWLASTPGIASQLRDTGAKLLLLDDHGQAQQQADIVVNSLVAPLSPEQSSQGSAQVFSGADWLHLPPRAVQLRGGAGATTGAMGTELSQPFVPSTEVHSALVSFGGSPVDTATNLVLEALAQLRFGGKVLVIPAAGNCPAPGGLDVDFLPASAEFHGLLAASDLAILAGGLSLYEAAFFGVPSLCIPLNHHQQQTALKLERAGCCRNLGLLESLTPEVIAPGIGTILRTAKIRRLMSRRGSSLFDGKGVSRTLDLILAMLE